MRLALGELEALAGTGAAGLLAFLHAGIASQESVIAKGLEVFFRKAHKSTRQAHANRTGLADWPAAGDHAAARMLVSTLACEWGSRALRINALVVPADADASALDGLIAGYRADYAAYYDRCKRPNSPAMRGLPRFMRGQMVYRRWTLPCAK